MATAERDLRRERLNEVEREIAQWRPRYEAVKALMGAPQRAEILEDLFKQIGEVMELARPATGEVALFCLGRIHQMVKVARAPFEVMDEYEGLREKARKLRESLGER